MWVFHILMVFWFVSDKSTYRIFGWNKSSEKISLDCTSIQLVLIFRKLSDIYYDVQTVLGARFSKRFRFKNLSTNKLLVVLTVYVLDRRNLRLSIISNPLWGFSNHKRYPQILCGLSSNHVRYPQILCGPCSCDSRFFLVIPYIFSITRGFL